MFPVLTSLVRCPGTSSNQVEDATAAVSIRRLTVNDDVPGSRRGVLARIAPRSRDQPHLPVSSHWPTADRARHLNTLATRRKYVCVIHEQASNVATWWGIGAASVLNELFHLPR